MNVDTFVMSKSDFPTTELQYLLNALLRSQLIDRKNIASLYEIAS